jgi:hypothetical protein
MKPQLSFFHIIKNNDCSTKKKKLKKEGIYFFFRYGKPVRLLTPTLYPGGNSQGLPLFGDLLLKK